MLLTPSFESPKDEESRETSFETEVGENLDPSVVEGGKLKVRYITGKASAGVTWSNRENDLLKGGNELLAPSISQEFRDCVPDQPAMPRRTYGFKQHVFQLIMSMFMVASVLGLVLALLGACIFLIGVALPFEMI